MSGFHLQMWLENIHLSNMQVMQICKELEAVIQFIFQARSQNSLRSAKSSSHTVTNTEEVYLPPLDVLTIKIKSLKVTNEDFRRHALKVTFFDQLLISSTITPVRARSRIEEQTIAQGTLSYDPSDYEKMCMFADHPLVGKIVPTLTT